MSREKFPTVCLSFPPSFSTRSPRNGERQRKTYRRTNRRSVLLLLDRTHWQYVLLVNRFRPLAEARLGVCRQRFAFGLSADEQHGGPSDERSDAVSVPWSRSARPPKSVGTSAARLVTPAKLPPLRPTQQLTARIPQPRAPPESKSQRHSWATQPPTQRLATGRQTLHRENGKVRKFKVENAPGKSDQHIRLDRIGAGLDHARPLSWISEFTSAFIFSS